MDSRSRGLASALLAYLLWGFFPIYFKALANVPAFEVLAHRILWSVVLLAVAAPLLGRWSTAVHALGPGKRLAILGGALLIAANWVAYIWAVQAGRVLEASVGYFVNPLVSVLLGVAFMRERLRRRQLQAVALAALGVLALVIRLHTLPWLPLALALTFGLYGLVRKRAGVDAVGGLLAETLVLAPAALVVVILRARAGVGAFGGNLGTSALLAAAGPITAIPLILFAMGVKRLPLSTVGILQYLTPTLQFLLAVALYHEPFGSAHAIAFGFIWAALALYTWDSYQAVREAAASGSDVAPLPPPPVEG
jgi:chloramphenicol-sensitive protein RarD